MYEQILSAIVFSDIDNLNSLINKDKKEFINIVTNIDKMGNYIIWYVKKRDHEFNPSLLKFFIEHEISLEYTNHHGQTLLHYSIEKNYTNLFNFLLQEDCDIDAQDDAGMTPLHYAVSSLDEFKVKLLLVCGADPNIQDNCGYTPMMYLFYDFYSQLIENPNYKKDKCISIFLNYSESINYSLKNCYKINLRQYFDRYKLSIF